MKTNLSIARMNAGLTQRKAAEKSGIPLATLRNWEQGVYPPKIEGLVALSALYGCKIEDIVGGQFADLQAIGVATSVPKMTESEYEMLKIFREIGEDKQQVVLAMMRGLVS